MIFVVLPIMMGTIYSNYIRLEERERPEVYYTGISGGLLLLIAGQFLVFIDQYLIMILATAIFRFILIYDPSYNYLMAIGVHVLIFIIRYQSEMQNRIVFRNFY